MVTADEQIAVDKYNQLMKDMDQAKERWAKEADDDDEDKEQDGILQQAIQLAIEQGRGWKPGEKEEYLKTILDDNYIPPLFANTVQEVQDSGLQEAFTSLIYDEQNPTQLMSSFKQKGLDAYQNGQRNVVKNKQYYRDAINHWYESYAWALKIQPIQPGDYAYADTDDITYDTNELNNVRTTLCGNIALSHMQLGNWGHVRDECLKAMKLHDGQTNIKILYRLARAYEILKEYECAGDTLEQALVLDSVNKDVLKLQKQLSDKIRKARTIRQQRERKRSERVANVKAVWKHCNSITSSSSSSNTTTNKKRILLGRVPLVSSVTDDEIDEDAPMGSEIIESRWHHHLPNSGLLPNQSSDHDDSSAWEWPCMFLYPTHSQSDFIKKFHENDLLAYRMAEAFPEPDEDEVTTGGTGNPRIPWDYNNEFSCSQLAVYFEVHTEAVAYAKTLFGTSSSTGTTSTKTNNNTKTTAGTQKKGPIVHPESVELLIDQASCMRYYESTRALLGDEGIEMAAVVRAKERYHLYQQRKNWKKLHGNLWNSKPDSCPVVRVHPGVSLREVLTDPRCVIPNFLVTFIMIPENHPMHEIYLKEHECIGLLEPTNKD